LRKIPIRLFFLLSACLLTLSCGSSTPSSTHTTGLKNRAFITNSVNAGTETSGVFIVDAQNDIRGNASPISAGNTPGMMVVTPNRAQTLVFSGSGTQSSDNALSLINNASESNAAHVTLPGMTQSFVVSPDSSTAYVAVPTAPVTGESPGVVQVIAMSSGTVTGQANVPSVQYLSIGNTGNRLLGFIQGDNATADSVAVITPSNIGLQGAVVTVYVPGFDHPVAAFFSSDDKTAYVINCGPECGGTQASLQLLDLTTNTAGAVVDVPAASVALIVNSTMYLAGTPVPASPCTGETTQATTCGLLTILDLNSMTVTNTSPIIITDGYHTKMAMGANGQLYIGANTCTEIIPPVPPPPDAETRGCLSIYNTLTTAVGTVPATSVLIPPQNGDVTGIQPIANRNVVYVVQGASLGVYSDSIDAFEYNPNDPDNPGRINGLVGQLVDVVTVDF
jgi:hypothetical protein